MFCLVHYFWKSLSTECRCNIYGIKRSSPGCDDGGICTCKPNYTGEKCDHCAKGFYNFPKCQSNVHLFYTSNYVGKYVSVFLSFKNVIAIWLDLWMIFVTEYQETAHAVKILQEKVARSVLTHSLVFLIAKVI